MRVRMLDGGLALAILQEDHTDVSAQFAAHWGNETFDKLRPYESTVFATQWHDSGYREWEGRPPVDPETGLPEGRGDGGRALEYQLRAHVKNIDWVGSQDPYAGILVSMHRTGLWQSRYGIMEKPEPAGGKRTLTPEIQVVLEQLEAGQAEQKQRLLAGDPKGLHDLWINYRLLQVYDILSLYFCGSGFKNGQMVEQVVAPIPLGYDTDETAEVHLIPTQDGAGLKVEPYPFDASPISIGVRVRVMKATEEGPLTEEAAREAFYKAPRQVLEYAISR